MHLILYIKSVCRVNEHIHQDYFLSCYISIIVQTGSSEGKSVGQWFGPNTIAQVLR